MEFEDKSRLEPDTYFEGDETLDSDELTSVLEASLAEMRAYSEGKSEMRTTFILKDGTRIAPEMLTHEDYLSRHKALNESASLSYDADVDTLGIHLSQTPIANTDEVAPGVLFDYDAQGKVIGIEVLDLARRLNMKIA